MSASTLLVGVYLPGAAFAQSSDHAQLEEVVVTAQKRAQNLQDVPVAVTAIAADTLAANRVTTVRDLSTLAPNLVVRTQIGGSGLPIYTMRGLVGLGGVIGSDKGVSVYIDGVYLGAAYGSIIELAEIERIEVLRGPQGTLFGRNSTGGAVSFISPEPRGEFGVKQTLTLGNYDQIRSMTSIDTGQLGAFSARVSYTHSERRGDMRNLGAGTRWDFTPANGGKPTILTSPKWLGGYNNEAFAGAVKFEPVDNFTALLRFDYAESDFVTEGWGATYAQPSIYSLIATQPNQALMTPITKKRPKAVNNAATVPGRSKTWGGSLTTRFSASDSVSVKNILAYRKTSFSSPWTEQMGVGGLINVGGPVFASLLGPALAASTVGAPFALRTGSNGGDDRQWSDEIQLNVDTRLLTLTAGALYYEQTSSRAPFGEEVGLGRVRSGVNVVFPGGLVPFAGQPITTMGRETTLKMRSYAGYAQGEFHVTSQLDLIGGVRYTKDLKKGVDYTLYNGTSPLVLLVDYQGGHTTYLLGANYKVTDSFNVYGKFSTGFISGGGTSGVNYNPETAESWDFGLKADWFDRRLRTNLALFRVKYGNLQIPIRGGLLSPPQPAVTNALVNAGDARAKGLELETTFTPVRGLTFSGGLGYTDFKYVTLLPAVTTGNVAFLPAYRPKWTLSLAAEYDSQPVFGDAYVSAHVGGNWKSKQYSLGGVTSTLAPAERALYVAGTELAAYWVVNASVALKGLKVAGAETTVTLWARNLLDDKSVSYSASSFLTTVPADYERARTVGVDFTVKF